MPQPRIALVTTRPARDKDEDLAPLVEALQRAGAEVGVVDWDDTSVDWSGYAVAVLRSTWDYMDRLDAFLAWVDRAAAQTLLLNPAAIVRWNIDKHYLGELAAAGVATVRGQFVEPGADAQAALANFLSAYGGGGMGGGDTQGNGSEDFEFVVKPCVGAGSRDARRHAVRGLAAATEHLQRLLDAGRSALLQPYLARVDEHGETALLWFNGEFSHAIRKGPLLRRDEDATRALFAPEHISSRAPSAAEMALARQALACLPGGEPLLYARVDLIQDAAGQPCLLELELSEPSLFFAFGPGSADRYAAAILARL
jgi:hypothetical protein